MKLALTNGSLFDGVSGTLQPAMTVLVDGNRIAEVGPIATLRVPPDMAGSFREPGLTVRFERRSAVLVDYDHALRRQTTF